MKRTILTLSLLVLAMSAGAWNKTTYATILTLASQRLSPEVKSAVQKSLGGELATAIISDKEALTFSVDENLAPLRNQEGDALVVAEKSIERLRGNRGSLPQGNSLPVRKHRTEQPRKSEVPLRSTPP